ncbi:MAG: hypothetical protein EBT13_10330 [Rhodobacteraceae bacterium]|jgi:hypothetical protein|nr:hypothetical protein [Paracoccaceae bacterium]
MTAGIGHNRGPSMEPGQSWRRHVWTKARHDLLPTLPIEVLRLRIRRAQDLGLPYKTYASIRAQTGEDVIGFLFSSNALRMIRKTDIPKPVAEKLRGVKADRSALLHPPLVPADFAARPEIDAVFAAPLFTDSWPDMRAKLRRVLADRRGPSDRYLIVGETGAERDWAAAARCAGFVSGTEYFGLTD